MSGIIGSVGYKSNSGQVGVVPKGTVLQTVRNVTDNPSFATSGGNYANRISPTNVDLTAMGKNSILAAWATSNTGSSNAAFSCILSFEHNVAGGSYAEWGEGGDGTYGIMYSYYNTPLGTDVRRGRIVHGTVVSSHNVGDAINVKYIGWRWHSTEIALEAWSHITVQEIANL